jgi:hypothetical protein
MTLLEMPVEVLMDIMTAILNSALSQVFLGDHQQPWTGPGATRCMAAAIEPVGVFNLAENSII